jgi:integrase
MAEGIEVRHRTNCASHRGGRCGCARAYRAYVDDRDTGTRLRKTFPTLDAARSWRIHTLRALANGEISGEGAPTLKRAASDLLEAMEKGTALTRSGRAYKPATVRAYRESLALHVLPALEARRLHEIRQTDLQSLVDQMLAAGAGASTVRNALLPMRVIYRRARQLGRRLQDPCQYVHVPAQRGRRERIATPAEARRLLDALSEADRVIWAAAAYAGLRRGELMALREEDVDLDGGFIRVERAFDPKAGAMILPKSDAAIRRVPITQELASFLEPHLARRGSPRRLGSGATRLGRRGGLLFGRSATQPFDYSALRERARRAWRKADVEPITLHELRHTFASLMIAAGVPPKALQTYMGHSSIATTFDLYGHLMPGSLREDAARLDAYLARDRATSWT